MYLKLFELRYTASSFTGVFAKELEFKIIIKEINSRFRKGFTMLKAEHIVYFFELI